MGGRKCGSRTDGIIIPAHPFSRCTHVRCTLITTHHHTQAHTWRDYRIADIIPWDFTFAERQLYRFKNIKIFADFITNVLTTGILFKSDVMKCVPRVESGESRLQQRPAASRDGPGTGLGVVSVSEKSNTVQISLNSSSWRPKVGGGSSLLCTKYFNVIVITSRFSSSDML